LYFYTFVFLIKKIKVMSKSVLETYDPKEELFNAYSHGAGVVMAVVASIFLIIKGSYLSIAQWVGLWVYSFSLILVFTSSTLYHFAQTQNLRYWYKKLDHTAIYYLIALLYLHKKLIFYLLLSGALLQLVHFSS